MLEFLFDKVAGQKETLLQVFSCEICEIFKNILFHRTPLVAASKVWLRVFLQIVDRTVQKMKFSIKDFFSRCEQIRRKLRIWLHLLKKSLMKNFIFCAVPMQKIQPFFSQWNNQSLKGGLSCCTIFLSN